MICLENLERIDLKMTNDLNYRDKTKDELIKELKKLQQEYDSQKTSYEKVITKHKHIEEALQQEKENFRQSLDDSPLGERIATKEGNTIYANKTLLDLRIRLSRRTAENSLWSLPYIKFLHSPTSELVESLYLKASAFTILSFLENINI